MSGEIFHPLDSSDELDVTKWNPLTCYLCNEKYEDPCILSCYHSFCSRCLRGRDVDHTMDCPLCGVVTALKEDQSLPTTDQLTKFLVDQTSTEEKEPCANCDKVSEEMFFCNTCSQPLCSSCRDETHKAKMFARHDVVTLSKRTKEIHRECPVHLEPYILFSTEKKTMLCINCFRDMKIESRSHCVDLETAYTQGCNKLDQSMQAVRDLQHSVRDSIFLLKALLNEILQNSQMEKKAITDLYDTIQEQITEKKAVLLTEVDTQFDKKEKLFKAELVTLKTLLPTLHTHLVMSAAFSSSANRFEFLDLAYLLMDRLKSIIHQQHPLHPSQGGQICTDYKAQFAKCMEPLLFQYRNAGPLSSISTSSSLALTSTTGALTSNMSVSSAVPTINPRNLYSGNFSQNGRRSGYNTQKLHFTDTKGVFADHCVEFDKSHKDFCQRVEKMKNSVQELQRDITLRRCLAKKTSVTDLQKSIDGLEIDLEAHYAQTEQRQPALEKHWEELVQQIANEQDFFQVQLHNVVRLKQEIGLLKTILTQLTSFVTSITVLTERLAPKLSQTCKDSEHDNSIALLFEEINTMQPDSQHRVDAIRLAQEERETLSASNRVNPLDKELIKTKGMLKAPSARSLSRRNSTKRESREFKDFPSQNISESSESKEETMPSQTAKCFENSISQVVQLTNEQTSKSDSSKGLSVDNNVEGVTENNEVVITMSKPSSDTDGRGKCTEDVKRPVNQKETSTREDLNKTENLESSEAIESFKSDSSTLNESAKSEKGEIKEFTDNKDPESCELSISTKNENLMKTEKNISFENVTPDKQGTVESGDIKKGDKSGLSKSAEKDQLDKSDRTNLEEVNALQLDKNDLTESENVNK